MITPISSLVIDRAVWAPGNHLSSDASSLLMEHAGRRRQCCLGILATACGVPDASIRWLEFPRGVRSMCAAPSLAPLFADSPFSCGGFDPAHWEVVIAALNDTTRVDDATRESWIAAAFDYVLGIEVEFTGEYPDGPRDENGEVAA